MNEKFMWSYQARVKFYVVEWLTNLLCSVYSDGLSSVTGKEGICNARKHRYAKTLVETTTISSDISLVYNMIELWYI